MDFTGRSSQAPQPAASGQQFGGTVNNTTNSKRSSKGNKNRRLLQWGAGLLGLLLVILVVAVIVVIGLPQKSEASYVDSSKLQAVFLNTGQVYFGNVKTLNSKFLVLDNIYYLQTSSNSSTTNASTANTNVSLVKLGCELHEPYDQMVINRDQVTFWENLQSDGQVAKAVATFQKDNPDGQKCSDQSAAPNTTSNVQGNSSTATTPAPSTTDTTKK